MDARTRTVAVCGIALCILAGCGGGSSGSGSSPAPSPDPDPPPPPSADTPLALTASNAEGAAISGMKLPENLLQVFLTAQELLKDAVDANATSRQFNCGIRGTATTTAGPIRDHHRIGCAGSHLYIMAWR